MDSFFQISVVEAKDSRHFQNGVGLALLYRGLPEDNGNPGARFFTAAPSFKSTPDLFKGRVSV
jgi:hypothetical protein